MPDPRPILEHLGPFLMVLFRLSGLFVFAPLLSSSILPVRSRLFLALVMASAVYPTLPPAQQGDRALQMDVFTLLPAIAGETLIGAAIGLLAALPMFAAQLGGLVMSQQAGLAIGQVFNPALDIEAEPFGQLLQYLAVFAFLVMGGLELLFIALAETFARVPVGGAGLSIAPLELVVGVAGSGFDLALRVAAPVLCIILIETIASSVLMKTIPQINIQSLGFAIKIIVAVLALVAGLAAMERAISEDTGRTLSAIVEWARTMPEGAATPAGGGGR